jgi:hypothetical protein
MPKFNLYQKSTGLPGDIPARVEVGWSAGHVQLATCSDDLDALRALGAAAAPDQPDWRGIFLPLDREQVNDLIRNLRRARDSAFGRDE